MKISACFMFLFSILGKFGAVLASIPLSIFAALYCVLFAYAVSAGLGFLQFCNINSFRTKFILGFSFFMGLSIPQYFREYYVVSGYGPVHTRSITVRGSSLPLLTIRHIYNAPQEQHAFSQKKFFTAVHFFNNDLKSDFRFYLTTNHCLLITS
ncbi:hypothetical protein BHE74_00053869 [Ensete ventricosum]|nr:hypothetical protein BHE74_00053869 [Ensete ventricosum]